MSCASVLVVSRSVLSLFFLQEAVNGEEEGGEEDADAAAGLDLSLGKKKKKRKPKARTDEEFGALVEDTEAAPDGDKENEDEGLPGQPKLPWDGSDRDYTYQELLGGCLLLCLLQNPYAHDCSCVGVRWIFTDVEAFAWMQTASLAFCGRTIRS